MKDTYERINNTCIVILTFIAITVALIYTKTVLIPFVISLFIFSVSGPVIDWFQKKLKIPRSISVILTMAIFLVGSFFVSLLVVKSLNTFINGIDEYQERFTQTVEGSVSLLNDYGIELNGERIRESFRELPIFSIFKKLTGQLVSFISNAILIMIMVLFLIGGGATSEIQNVTLQQVQYKVSKYVATKFTVSFITALLIAILFFGFSVELAFMFAVLTFLLNFIPSVGSIIATLLPVPVLILQFGFGLKMAIILLASFLIQFIIGNVIEPKLMGENLGLHPIAILLFLLFWGLVWGIPGMFLAVPITAVLKIVFSRIETTKRFSRLLEGKLD
ncbi:AI-2E family transporter [Halobacteriovorax sp. HLS]|uniref:AI-2E family transporter n=1 Tax=Halobacteriovorax sp. HLS TaxID=2234000 RepID=UPI000FD89359|nr:AI-2E family transporter [Halobacteriovorax sp. HLS]